MAIKLQCFVNRKSVKLQQIELTSDFVKEFNDFLQYVYLPLDEGTCIPYFDAEDLADIYVDRLEETIKLGNYITKTSKKPIVNIRVRHRFADDRESNYYPVICIDNKYCLITEVALQLKKFVGNQEEKWVDQDSIREYYVDGI